MTTLVIVESPNKVSKISTILGDGYKVMASVGHVRDLPPKELGIEPPSFELTYQPTERGQGVLAKLKAAVAQADRVLLATDPDREGEAISWHLADALRLKNPERVTFTAITKEKILAAFAAPRPLDMQRVHAQEPAGRSTASLATASARHCPMPPGSALARGACSLRPFALSLTANGPLPHSRSLSTTAQS